METKNMADKSVVVSCPSCQKQVIWNTQQTYRPFCSERCKLIDLGEWASNEKAIPGEPVHTNPDIDYGDLLH
jgi:endogenous inhibitor of DNA gyrase (YacG/DUF329 family)